MNQASPATQPIPPPTDKTQPPGPKELLKVPITFIDWNNEETVSHIAEISGPQGVPAEEAVGYVIQQIKTHGGLFKPEGTGFVFYSYDPATVKEIRAGMPIVSGNSVA